MASVPNAPLTCLSLWCKAGSNFEEKGEEGLAHFLEHMIFKGSSKLKEGEFDKKIEALGGSSNAATGLDDVHYYVLVPPEVVPKALDLLLNLVLSPLLNDGSYKQEKEVVLEEIAQHNDQPEEQLFQKLLESCWPQHSYGRRILGFEETIISSIPQEMREFHKRRYKKENLVLSIAGFIPKNIQDIINKSELKEVAIEDTKSKAIYNQGNIKPIFKTGREEIDIPRLQLARITMAWPLPPANDQLMIMGIDIACSILAEGRRSRLVSLLKEELQLVESIDIDITSLELGGLIIMEACCTEKNIKKAEREINNILNQMIIEEPTDREVERAKQQIKANLCFSLEQTIQIAGINGSNTLWRRKQSLLEPLKYLEYWNSNNLREEVFINLNQKNSFTIIAKGKED